MPQGICFIGDFAFSGCTALRRVEIPDSVTHIGNYAFDNCSSLGSVNLPNSVVSVGANPFRSCKKMSGIDVSPDHPVLTVRSGVLFDKVANRLICYPNVLSSTSYTVPSDVCSIGDHAFYQCDALQNVILPDRTVKIGKMRVSSSFKISDLLSKSVFSLHGCCRTTIHLGH